MSSTDNRVVKMEFDNASFKAKASETKQSLADLNKAVDSTGKSKGLMDLDSGMQRVSVTASKMSVIATTALATITNKAVNAGLSLAKSITLGPITAGFHLYESELTKLNTIMNATGQSQKKVQGALNDLNAYANKTIYSFDDMTTAVTKFTNAGLSLKKSTTLAKNFSNMVAYAGGSAQQASAGMYALTQMMQLGYIQLQDFKQFDNAGLATVKFKQTLIDAAVAQGELTKQGKLYVAKAGGPAFNATKSFNNSLQKQWATTKVLNTALGKYNEHAGKMGKAAFESAQKVRTFTAFMDTLKESIATGWSKVFRNLIGNLSQATNFWTTLSNGIGNAVTQFFNFADATIHTWRAMGGATKVLQGFKNILAPIGALFSTVGKAWHQAFPDTGKGAGKGLYGLSAGFAAITSPLQLLAKLIRLTASPMATFFQIVKIGGTAIRDVIKYITNFVTGIASMVSIKAPSVGGGGFFGWIKNLGGVIKDVIDQISKMIDKGKSLKDAFGSVKIKLPSLPSLPDLGGLFGGGKAGAGKAGGALSGLIAPLKDIDFSKIGIGFKKVGASAQDGAGKVASAGQTMGKAISSVWDWFKKFMGDFNFDDLVSSFNLAILATFMLSISRFFNTMSKSFGGFAGLGKDVHEVLDGTKDALKSFQTQARAKLILNIAIAIGVLAAALWVLSKIPVKNLLPAFLALAGTFRILNKSMGELTKLVQAMDGAKTAINLVAVSVAIVALGLSMILLATAMLIMNKVKWTSVIKGLLVMRVMLVSMQQLGELSKGSYKNILGAATAIALIAGSMVVLAAALLLFKLVDWGSMAKAGVALAGVALAVGLLALIPYEGIAKVGLAMLATSVGMIALATALIMFKLVKWESIAKLAVVLLALGISIALIMAVGGTGAAATILAISVAMVGLALAGLMLNKVNWSSIAKIGVILLGIVVAVALFATVLTIFLYAIAPVAPVLILLAAGFALLGLGMLAFAAAMAIAITLGAAGVAAFAALATGAAVAIAVFMQTLASEAPILKNSFLQILQSLIDTIVEAVPMIIDGFKRLWAAVKKELGGDDKKQGAGDAGKSWMSSLMDGIKAKIPELAAKAGDLIVRFAKAMVKHAADIGAVAAILLARFIQGVASHMGGILDAAGNLIVKFVEGIGRQANKIAKAAYNTVITFINKLAETIRTNGPRMGDAMSNLGIAMVQGLIGGIGAMFGNAMGAIEGLAKGMVNKAKGILKIFSPSRVFADIGKFLVLGLTNGIQNNAASAIIAVASMVSGQIAVASQYVNGFIQSLDQQALAAKAKADGLAIAAKKAADAAKLTKGKGDDKAAKGISRQADAASKAADQAQARADAQKAALERADQFTKASTIDKAKMRSEDAQNQLDAAKASEAAAARDLAAANALDRQAHAKGVSLKERKRLEAEAAKLRAQARADAAAANAQLDAARASAADALAYQKKAGDEAAAAFQATFDADAKAAADEEAFNKLSDSDKAIQRRKQAEDLQAKAAKDLTDAKALAYTDLEAANNLASQAMNEADQARQYLNDAAQLEASAAQGAGGAIDTGGVNGTVVNLDPTDAAAIAMNDYSKLYDSATAAAAATKTVEFNQYNTSPEALSPTEVYRQTNNLLTSAADRLSEAA